MLCKQGKAFQCLAASVAAGRGGALARAKFCNSVASFFCRVNCATAGKREQQLPWELTAYQVGASHPDLVVLLTFASSA